MPTVEDRFWAKVRTDGPIPKHCPEIGECWLWTGCIRNPKAGYGAFQFRGRFCQAHRVSFCLASGKWPSAYVLHKCDNRRCVRPSHLFEGTAKDNALDAVSKGRWVNNRGERCGSSKLTEAKVKKVQRLYAQGDVTQDQLAKKFGVSSSMVSMIVNRKRWLHIQVDEDEMSAFDKSIELEGVSQ